ncbi:hypothetical protein [Marinicellulosiphila megalodicopiae]|uniref:hypothetical protein n=1 Tax=Marinicellulosiphila megalodicopiae TaxID=2724896 RepID=UPI003BB102FD
MTEKNKENTKNDVVIFESKNGEVEVILKQDTVWLRQEQMAELFGRDRTVITRHIGNIFKEGELEEKSNVQNMHIAHSDKPVKLYNLDVIISVGYRECELEEKVTIKDSLIVRKEGKINVKRQINFMKKHTAQGYTVTKNGFENITQKFKNYINHVHKEMQYQQLNVMNMLANEQTL